MTYREALRTTVKLSGLALLIYAAVSASSYLPLVLELSSIEGMDHPVASYVSALVTPVVLGLLLWLFPARIADSVFRTETDNPGRDEWLQGFESIGIRLLGVYLLYHACSDLAHNAAGYVRVREAFPGLAGGELFRLRVGMAVNGVQVAIAAWLIIGARGISNLLRRIRYAGR